MDITRRMLGGQVGGAALALLSPWPAEAASSANAGEQAWYRRIKRIVQVNFTERDAEDFDVTKWIDYLVSTQAECTFLSISSPVAFYPTAIADFPRSRWLGQRDIVGECVQAARAAGIRVIGRISPNIARTELADRHPDWFRRDAAGNLQTATTSFSRADAQDPSAAPDYASTCTFTGYFSDFVPRVIEEVMDRYRLDGMFTNGWPRNDVPACHCAICRTIGEPTSETYRQSYQQRVIELWNRYRSIIARHNPAAIYVGNLGSPIKAGELDLQPIIKQAVWSFADNQGRTGDFAPSWDASQQGRIAAAFAGDRPSVVSTAAYSFASSTAWRSVSGNPYEVRARLFQTLASGGAIHLHWLGYHAGFVEDRRWQPVGREVLKWQAANAPHFDNLRSLAKVAVVVSPKTNAIYDAPAGTDGLDAFQGVYKALSEDRIAFDVVLDTDLSPSRLGHYSVLVLPNIAAMDDRQAAQIAAFAAQGGSVLATFETGLYDGAGKPRAEFALGGLFGIRRAGPRIGYGTDGKPGMRRMPGAPSMQRIARPHPVLDGFRDTNWIQGSSWRVPIEIEGQAYLTDIPQHPVYPVEAVFPKDWQTAAPTAAIRQFGTARLVYLSGDIDGGYWRNGAADLGDLIKNALRWMVAGRAPVQVTGEGLVEVFGWETRPGYAVHLLNATNPGFRGSALLQSYPVGPQQITLAVDRPIRRARLLRSGTGLPFEQVGGTVRATVPSLDEYEVAVFET